MNAQNNPYDFIGVPGDADGQVYEFLSSELDVVFWAAYHLCIL